MARWSPTVEPYEPRPLDFSSISDALANVRARRRERRQERREDELDQERRTRIAHEREGELRELRLAGAMPADEFDAELQMERSAQGGYVNDELARRGPVALEGIGQRRQQLMGTRDLQVGPLPLPARAPQPSARMPYVRPEGITPRRFDVEGKQWVFDPLSKIRTEAASKAAISGAEEEAERGARYRGALEAGIDSTAAARLAYGPTGLSFEERLRLGEQRGEQQKELAGVKHGYTMEQEAYRAGNRLQLSKLATDRALAVVRARGSGNVQQTRKALLEYQAAVRELTLSDAKYGLMQRLIPNDPLARHDMQRNETLAPALEEAEQWVASYLAPGGGRAKLEDEVRRRAPKSEAQTPAPRPQTTDSRTEITQQEFDDVVELLMEGDPDESGKPTKAKLNRNQAAIEAARHYRVKR